MCHLAKFRTPTHSSLKSAGGAAEEGYGRTRVAAPSMAQPAYPAPDPSPQKLSCNQLLQVLASSSQPCRVGCCSSHSCAQAAQTLSVVTSHIGRVARVISVLCLGAHRTVHGKPLDVICQCLKCRCVDVVSLSVLCETCATFCSRKWQLRPRNGSNVPLRAARRLRGGRRPLTI